MVEDCEVSSAVVDTSATVVVIEEAAEEEGEIARVGPDVNSGTVDWVTTSNVRFCPAKLSVGRVLSVASNVASCSSSTGSATEIEPQIVTASEFGLNNSLVVKCGAPAAAKKPFTALRNSFFCSAVRSSSEFCSTYTEQSSKDRPKDLDTTHVLTSAEQSGSRRLGVTDATTGVEASAAGLVLAVIVVAAGMDASMEVWKIDASSVV